MTAVTVGTSPVAIENKSDGDDTLDTIAGKIKACLEKAQSAQSKAESLRVTAGQLLVEARRRVDAGEYGRLGWKLWCTHNLPKRSYRDVQRLLAISRAPDPAAAAEVAREATRVQVAKSREGVIRMSPPNAHVSTEDQIEPIEPAGDPVADDPLEGAIAAVRRLGTDDLASFKVWFVGHFGADDQPTSSGRFPKPDIAPAMPRVELPCHKLDGKCGYGACQSAGKCLAQTPVSP